MAKLNNVKVTAQTIEVSGIKYAQSDAKAVAGDIIRFDGGSIFVTEGAYYKVTRIDSSDDPQIIDNDGDEYDLAGNEFAVFKAATTPITSDDTITHEGAQYRKVARKAEIGELVVIIANTTGHVLRNGDVVKITKGPLSSSNDSAATDRSATWMSSECYRVLEPLKTPAPIQTLPTSYVIHDGKVYVKESRKAAVGEKVVVTKTKTDYSRHFAAGDVGTRVSGEGWVNADIQVRFASGTTKFIGPSASNSEYAVLVPTDSVTIGDVEYLLEKRKGNVGENVLVVKTSGVSQDQYEVDAIHTIRVSNDGVDARINTKDGGTVFMYEREYFVLTPKAAATQYREVNRIAAVGERIKIVKRVCSSETYKNGDILTVEYMTTYGNAGVASAKREGNVQGAIHRSEYVVLEPIPTAKVPQAPYEPKSGDKVRAKSSKDVMTLTTRRPEFDGFLGLGKAWGYEVATHDWIGETQFDVIERAEDAKVTPERLKVGEYARVLVSGKDVPKGGIVRIEADDRDSSPFKGREIGGDEDYDYFRPDQLERVPQADVDAAKPSPTFKVGDYVKLTIADGKRPSRGYGSVKNGDTGVIKRINGTGVVVDFPAQSGWYGLLTEFTPATAEDVKAVEDAAKQRELTAKWTAIGRKVGEIKSGDVVRIKRSFSAAGVKEGDIETVKSLYDDGVRLIKLNPQGLNAWVGCNFVELVAPVETLFNA